MRFFSFYLQQKLTPSIKVEPEILNRARIVILDNFYWFYATLNYKTLYSASKNISYNKTNVK